MAHSLAQHRLALRPGRVQHSRPRLVSKRTAVLVHALHKTELDVVLVGDIGGTNARLSAWRVDLEGAGAMQIDKETYPSQDFKSLDDVVDAFLARPAVRERPPHAAALAIAGAVSANKCLMTNVEHWPIIDGDDIQAKHGFRVALLNDFEAVGYGIPVLGPHDVVALNDVPVQPKAPKVVMGPGTGLGAAQLMWDTGLNAYKVWPGEGAHATFAPRGWKQKALARFVTERCGHCEIEEVACGSGLELIYEFLQSDEAANRPELLKHRTKKAVKEISAAALDGSDPLAVEAVDLMFAIVGAEAGAMALRCLAKGGVYIAGGITPKLLPRVKAGSLLEGFLMRAGREPFHKILTQTPLFVITNERVGAMGAREVAKNLLHQRRQQQA